VGIGECKATVNGELACTAELTISTPGMTCSWGKWPQKNCSLTLTHLRPLAHWPGS